MKCLGNMTGVASWLAVVLLVSAVRADEPSPEGVAYFERHVRPVLVEHCYACHSAGENRQKGGLRLDRREGWQKGGDQGPALVPGDPAASLLIRAVRHADPDLRMPPDKALPAAAVQHLEQWVRLGAPAPRDRGAENAGPPTHPSDPVAGRSHWAFRPLNRLTPPIADLVAPFSTGLRTTSDAYVAQALQTHQLQPSPPVERPTLLRRFTFQLTGLPPTEDDVREFVADENPDAEQRVVERLLASPQFGVRWGRHWLDLARYADSNGLDENFLFREAWRYRNWVIEAVNRDLPYDRFLTEQIAGDLLPYGSLEQRDQQRIAAGFLVVGPKVLLGNDPQQRRLDVADEQLETIGRTVLGQTLGCARCHDHKFDPIPTADYYALAGIFTSTQVMQVRYMLNEQRMMERLVGLGAEGEVRNEAYEQYWREQPKRKERESRARAALEALERGDEPAFAAIQDKHASEIAAGARETERPREQRVAAQQELLAQVRAELAAPPPIPPRAMIPAEEAEPRDEAIRLAGKFDRLGDRVPRGFLRVITDQPVTIPSGHSGRLELARWLTDPHQGAGPLAARVLANRIWYQLIGRGLVRTVDNFGRTGESPSHPELLDHLAGRLLDSEWSVKSLTREIVLSRTFALSTQADQAAWRVDPDNIWLGRAHRRRLEPEALRDAMLQAAGELSLSSWDSTVSYLGDQATAVGDNKVRRRTDFPCRSIYLPVIRNDLPELFESFDFVNPHVSTGQRPQTLVATQGLFLLNDESVMAAADALARRVWHAESARGDAVVLDAVYHRLWQRSPTASEQSDVLAFVESQRKRSSEGQTTTEEQMSGELRCWTRVCQALLAASRFQLLD
ncbi:MAG: PSD1 and planctomycete cytochrome C domain-containing protein [Pirellulales bacterium]